MNNTVLRPAMAEEIPALTALSKAAFGTDVSVGGSAGGPPDYDSVEWHEEMRKADNLYSFMCKEAVIGGAVLFPDGENLYVGRIFIDPTLFGQGFGVRLMELIEQAFPDAKVIRLDTPEWNVRTNSFYAKCGYTAVGSSDGEVHFEKRR